MRLIQKLLQFFFYFKFSSLCLMESSNLVRQKNCLVMAAASAVQAAREQISGDEKVLQTSFRLSSKSNNTNM